MSSFNLRVIGFGWHALRLCEGRGSSVIHHALRKASERATPKLKLDNALISFNGNLEICSGAIAGVRYTIVQHVMPVALVAMQGENSARIAIFGGSLDDNDPSVLVRFDFGLRFAVGVPKFVETGNAARQKPVLTHCG